MNPENPVNPVRNISLAEKTIEDVLLHFGNTFGCGSFATTLKTIDIG